MSIEKYGIYKEVEIHEESQVNLDVMTLNRSGTMKLKEGSLLKHWVYSIWNSFFGLPLFIFFEILSGVSIIMEENSVGWFVVVLLLLLLTVELEEADELGVVEVKVSNLLYEFS